MDIGGNATQTWRHSPQAGHALNVLEVRNADGSVTRIVQEVDRASGVLLGEKTYENPRASSPDGFRLVASSDYQGGMHWALNRETGVMEQMGVSPGTGANFIEEGFAPDGSRLGQSATAVAGLASYTTLWTRDGETGHYIQTETATKRDDEGNVISEATTVRTYGVDGTELPAGDAALKEADPSLPELAGHFAASHAGGADCAGQLAGFDVVPLGEGDDGAPFALLNEDGDIAAEVTALADGYYEVMDLNGNTAYVSDAGKVLTPEQYETARTQPAADAVALMNSIIGLSSWSEMSELQRTAAVSSIYNTLGRIGAGELLTTREGAHSNGASWLDANRDGRLDAKDPGFAALRLWTDADGDGLSMGETRSMRQAGIEAIDLGAGSPEIVRTDGTREQLPGCASSRTRAAS